MIYQMEANIQSIEQKVVEYINKTLSPLYNVNINAGTNKYLYGNSFPDVIVVDKKTNQTLFIIEIKSSAQSIINSIGQLRNYAKQPATIYIIVPEKELNTLKQYSAIFGIKAKFGSYTVVNNEVTNVTFES